MELAALLGLLATVFSVGTLIPSVIEQITKQSPGMARPSLLAQVVFNNFLWISYGLVDGDTYIFGRSMIAGVIAVLSIILYYKYSNAPQTGCA
jgi:hypothetical protein